ncbi:unnamed protein product [Wuchereria bancrofti]|uniref:Uncharacterized protein n=1 Tax=Wuchereria bancrofti TaxID=6293 RepID=A0A3P7EX42_WUCBA|nr:unnamed protein product [Wuchereria bancrofti]
MNLHDITNSFEPARNAAIAIVLQRSRATKLAVVVASSESLKYEWDWVGVEGVPIVDHLKRIVLNRSTQLVSCPWCSLDEQDLQQYHRQFTPTHVWAYAVPRTPSPEILSSAMPIAYLIAIISCICTYFKPMLELGMLANLLDY